MINSKAAPKVTTQSLLETEEFPIHLQKYRSWFLKLREFSLALVGLKTSPAMLNSLSQVHVCSASQTAVCAQLVHSNVVKISAPVNPMMWWLANVKLTSQQLAAMIITKMTRINKISQLSTSSAD